MTEDTTPGRNGIDMIIEPVELIPDTGDDDNEIGEPFWVKYRTEEGLKTHHMRMVRVEDDSMEPELREGEWVVVDLASRRPEAGGKVPDQARGEPGGQTSRGDARRCGGGATPEAYPRQPRLRPLLRTRRRGPRQGGVGGQAAMGVRAPAPASR